MDLDSAARLFAELGNRTRLEMLRLLIKAGPEGLAVGELQRRTGVPASTLAFHLRGLVGAGLVTQEKRGRVILCQPCFPALREALAFLKEECCMGFGADAEDAAA
jgi:ArsR family transcriptional regulator, arsenate/arsenite/antimonite-responsive transcriptional repressor